MGFTLLLAFLSFNLLASEVVTLSSFQTNKDIQLSITDESLFQSAEKQFMSHACRLRTSTNVTLGMRETLVPSACRAEIIKFLLNAGYKSMDLDSKTFVKN